jgi:hypothetical protein
VSEHERPGQAERDLGLSDEEDGRRSQLGDRGDPAPQVELDRVDAGLLGIDPLLE